MPESAGWLRGVLQSRIRVGKRVFRDSDGKEGRAVTAERPSGTRGLRRVFAPAWPGGRNSGQLLPAPPHSVRL